MNETGVLSALQYSPDTSLLHRFDPRAKFIFFISYSTLLFTSTSLMATLGLGLIAIVLLGCAKFNPIRLWNSVKGIAVLLLIMDAVQMVSHSGGKVFVAWQGIAITAGGIETAAWLTCRWFSFYLIVLLMFATTSPAKQFEALRKLFTPLRRAGIELEAFVFMLTIAVLYIPYLIEDMKRILQAWKARGGQPAFWHVPRWGKEAMNLLYPLTIGIYRRAEVLSAAIESRGYRPGYPRTEYEPLRFGIKDTALVVGACLLPFAGLILQ
ncbi:energy-coupling factor transporter transmembrane protein EcfT [Paenibacillus mesophilus]|uniref:energy-coupling factor transporter transmembrane component T family protein n=1 Tax=Paenibacillus mesophilus TaxID=2582849 RepID=UPI00110F67ED|nr:energy-coupling factor transporter transmembrane component T [Paenibacillus mesophilus]TMV48590.1 energy-coupling factor transporter transmembrane protein EcfT [Paenibacillus mesophilus]